jgi:hypothetical protein
MASVYKSKNRKGKSHGVWRFKYKNVYGKWVYGTGWSDKQQTLDHARDVEAEHRAVRTGEKAAPHSWLKNRNKPIKEVIAEYVAWGSSCGGRGGRPWSKMNTTVKETYLDCGLRH